MDQQGVQELFHSLDKFSWQEEIRKKEPLANKTSVRVGGPADLFLTVHDLDELTRLFEIIREHQCPWFVLGKGSNLLIQDEGFPGIVIRLAGDFSQVAQVSSRQLVVGAGIANIQASRIAKKNNLSGMEFLTTIPGTMGGAAFMNAGAHGQEMKDIVEWVEFFSETGEVETIRAEYLDFSYRHSRFMQTPGIILKLGLQLQVDHSEAIGKREKEFIMRRKGSQPLDARTWGSVFVNPPGDSSGRLIESCGLKGKGIGQARISPKHANFIENVGGATFQDLLKTVEYAQKEVYRVYGIHLKMEGRIIPELTSKQGK